jgi:hypothetical protein
MPKLKKVPYTLSTGRKASPTTPLGKRNFSYLDAEPAWVSHRKLTAALNALRKKA